MKTLLRVSCLNCKEVKSVNPKGNPECSLEGLMMKLKFLYFGHLIRKASSLEKNLKLGKIEGKRRRVWQRMRWLDNITGKGYEFEQTPEDSDGQGNLMCCSPWGHKELDTT